MMRVVFALIASVSCVAIAAAEPVPLNSKILIDRDLPYVDHADPAQKLDVYLPTGTIDKPRPLLIWIHGGGWTAGSKMPCPAAGLVSGGYIAASVEYRFSNVAKFPAQIQDCQAAVRWLRAHHDQYHIDVDHVGAWGASAGGHLVTLLGVTGGKHVFDPIGENKDQSDEVQAVCDYFGPSDFNTIYQQAGANPDVRNIFFPTTGNDPCSLLLGKTIGDAGAEAAATSASPVTYVDGKAPPFLIVQGKKDTLVPFAQSVELADDLRKANVPVDLQLVPDAGHGGQQFNKPFFVKLIKDFFDRNLKGEAATTRPSDSIVK